MLRLEPLENPMTDEELKELVASNSRAISGLEALQKENERRWQETRQEIYTSRAETDRLVLAIHQDMGRLSRKLGDYAEGLCRPALERILRQRFQMTEIADRVRAWRNGNAIEIDMLGHANDRLNEAYVAEIKSTLRSEGIDQICEHLRRLPEFFPEHRGKDLYGILAAIDAPAELQRKVLKEGIYLVLVSDEAFELIEPEGFEPRNFAT